MDEIPLSGPDITEREIELVSRVLRSGRLAIGPMQLRFEEMVAQRAGRHHAVACSSGTAALHMALTAFGVGPGDEVIVPTFCFVAVANVVLQAGATPVFVDICPKTLNMDPQRVEAAITRRTKAVIAVENLGCPTYMEKYRSICDRHEIVMIEDACEALGGTYSGRAAGGFGHAAVFGFYPNKQITTGEGGMLVTDNARIADIARSLRNQGRAGNSAGGHPGASQGLRSWMSFERLGYNYRLSEIHAALGVAQMERLDDILMRRQVAAERYIERFMVHPDLILPYVGPDTQMSWFVFVVRLSDRYGAVERDRVLEGMHRHDVGAAAYFPCCHLMPQFAHLPGCRPGAFPISESVSQRTIALPFFTGLTARDADFAGATLELMISRENLSRS
ncbi:MAG: DegT/DnrJ/EryC1/StrS family aminotransferase [Phycisphaerales bacterium]|nr:DegT/DnrJ/EryC1/StrS family aminotransferase [Phycisphaerales bacterium]